MSSTTIRLTALLAALALLAGCPSFDKEAATKSRYMLEATRSSEAKPASGMHLEVRDFHVAKAYAASTFVYRKQPGTFEDDFYNEFFVPPGIMLGNVTRAWFSRSGLFASVQSGGSRIAPTHALEADVTALYGDYRKTPGEAVLGLSVVVLDAETDALVLRREYEQRQPLAGDAPADLVQGWDAALVRLLQTLEKDLSASLGGAADSSGGDEDGQR